MRHSDSKTLAGAQSPGPAALYPRRFPGEINREANKQNSREVEEAQTGSGRRKGSVLRYFSILCSFPVTALPAYAVKTTRLGSCCVPQSERCQSEQERGGCQRVCKVGKDCTRSAPLTAAWEGSPAERGGVARKFPEGKKMPNASIGRQLNDALTGASPSSKTVSFEAGQKVTRFRRKKSEKK